MGCMLGEGARKTFMSTCILARRRSGLNCGELLCLCTRMGVAYFGSDTLLGAFDSILSSPSSKAAHGLSFSAANTSCMIIF